MQRLWVTVTILLLQGHAEADPYNVLPTPNKLAITPDNFCLGLQNTLKTAKQNLTEIAAILCSGATATQLFKDMLVPGPNLYEGTGTPLLRDLSPMIDTNSPTVELKVAFAMRVPKSAVKTLLVEEKHAQIPYDSEAAGGRPLGNQLAEMKMDFTFGEPPKNEGDADTTFGIAQKLQVRAPAGNNFTETSMHELRQYLLHPNNFDFFMAGRTLVAPTEQFKKSVVLRGFMTDPTDATKTFCITIAQFLMNSRDQHAELVLAFKNFMTADVAKLYQDQIK